LVDSADSFVWIQSQLGMAGGSTRVDLLFPTFPKRVYDDDWLHRRMYWLDMVDGHPWLASTPHLNAVIWCPLDIPVYRTQDRREEALLF
jgi:hypothetical protein